MATRQGGVATQRDFHGGGEPAQAKARRILAGEQEGGLGLVVLRRQGLHPRRLWPGRERLDDAGGISPERTRSEGVDHPLAHALVLRRDLGPPRAQGQIGGVLRQHLAAEFMAAFV